ncbi:MAG: hypothetical protein LBU65_07035 [Planctomycetaceae bacterium]|jgi:endonuclease-3|nr:hypothetical protein [Planctomycetaceae bacterium]
MSQNLNTTGKIKALQKLIHKRYDKLPAPPSRTILEHLIYAAVLENASIDAADHAMGILEHYYIDWNEVRVSSEYEIAEKLSQLPDPLAAGNRVKFTLQTIFEAHSRYNFDLEELRKKTITHAHEYLLSITDTYFDRESGTRVVKGCTRFMADYVYQVALDGHNIPLDEASLRIFRLLDLTRVSDDKTRENVSGLERVIPKNRGVAFAMALHQFAAEFYKNADITALQAVLKTVDAKALQRDATAPVLVTPEVKSKIKKPVISLPLPLAKLDDDDDDADIDDAEAPSEFIKSHLSFASSDDDVETDDDLLSQSKKKKKKSLEKKLKQKQTGHSAAKPVQSKPSLTKPVTKKSEPSKPSSPKPATLPVKKSKPVEKQSSASAPAKKSPSKPVSKQKPTDVKPVKPSGKPVPPQKKTVASKQKKK